MKKLTYLLAAAIVVLVAAPMYGQSGCVNSPENPTVLLALVGSASGVMVAVRGRLRRK